MICNYDLVMLSLFIVNVSEGVVTGIEIQAEFQ